MTSDTPYRLHQSLGYALSVVSRHSEMRLDSHLKTLGLARITWCILLAVGVEKLGKPSEIAQFVGINRAATSRALTQMEAQGFLTRKSGPIDKRTRLISLTQKGRQLMGQATPFVRENAAALAARLTAHEHEELIRILGKLQNKDDPPLDHF